MTIRLSQCMCCASTFNAVEIAGIAELHQPKNGINTTVTKHPCDCGEVFDYQRNGATTMLRRVGAR